uniref:Uncharacterized protein n=1 Tax=Noctiluca scintillans TaxID=2966 RepID=A0A7S0ZV97_NOCSC
MQVRSVHFAELVEVVCLPEPLAHEAEELFEIVPRFGETAEEQSDSDDDENSVHGLETFYAKVDKFERKRREFYPTCTRTVGAAFLGLPEGSRLMQRRKKNPPHAFQMRVISRSVTRVEMSVSRCGGRSGQDTEKTLIDGLTADESTSSEAHDSPNVLPLAGCPPRACAQESAQNTHSLPTVDHVLGSATRVHIPNSFSLDQGASCLQYAQKEIETRPGFVSPSGATSHLHLDFGMPGVSFGTERCDPNSSLGQCAPWEDMEKASGPSGCLGARNLMCWWSLDASPRMPRTMNMSPSLRSVSRGSRRGFLWCLQLLHTCALQFPPRRRVSCGLSAPIAARSAISLCRGFASPWARHMWDRERRFALFSALCTVSL